MKKHPIKLTDIAWLAGLIEGEGSFGNHGTSDSPFITITSTDEDIVKRVAYLWNTRIYELKKRESNHKLQFTTRIFSHDAIGWMLTIYSFMGIRRRYKILEVISIWKVKSTGSKYFYNCGHPKTQDNTYYYSNKTTRCIICKKNERKKYETASNTCN